MNTEERKEILKELVKGRRIQQIADDAELNHNTIRYTLRNGNPTVETLQKIAKALGVHPSVLV